MLKHANMFTCQHVQNVQDEMEDLVEYSNEISDVPSSASRHSTLHVTASNRAIKSRTEFVCTEFVLAL